VREQESPEAFRERARAWAASNLPRADGQGGMLMADNEEELRTAAQHKDLQKQIFDAGFAGIRYPQEYGGQGLTHEYQLAWREATAGYQVPLSYSITHGIVGPTLLDFGTEEQKARHITRDAGRPGAVGPILVRAERWI
jgi:alkylation response protein AidB-like acyl-CoA dehydrogenase